MDLNQSDDQPRLMSFELSRELTSEEIDMLAGASGSCTAASGSSCIEFDC